MTRSVTHEKLARHYDRLWSEALVRIRAGRIDLDSVLQARLPDLRRGLTVIALPSTDTRNRVMKFVRELRRIEPNQYYCAPSDMHLTILSLFTATVKHQPFIARKEEYISAVDSVLQNFSPLRIEFRGVTASPGTVMVQGFADSNGLNVLRGTLRRELRRRGLSGGLDERYRLETAHMTVVRFRDQLIDTRKFLAALEHARGRAFGMTHITTLALVKNDWYMTRRILETLKRYRKSELK
jgi:2'-5' RNA ligase